MADQDIRDAAHAGERGAADQPAVTAQLLHDVARAKCLRRFNYDPSAYTSPAARERHIEVDAITTADGPEFRATVGDVLRWLANSDYDQSAWSFEGWVEHLADAIEAAR